MCVCVCVCVYVCVCVCVCVLANVKEIMVKDMFIKQSASVIKVSE